MKSIFIAGCAIATVAYITKPNVLVPRKDVDARYISSVTGGQNYRNRNIF